MHKGERKNSMKIQCDIRVNLYIKIVIATETASFDRLFTRVWLNIREKKRINSCAILNFYLYYLQ